MVRKPREACIRGFSVQRFRLAPSVAEYGVTRGRLPAQNVS